MTRIAISTGVYYRAHETQVNNHIANIFGGTSVVLARKAGDAPLDDRPHLIWDQSRGVGGTFDKVTSFAGSLAHYGATRSLNVPYGRQRHRMLAFLRDHDVTAILSEFGSEAARIAPVAQDAGIPLFAYFRGADASSYLSTAARIERYRRMMSRLRGVFSVSRFLLDNLESHGITHPDSFVIPSGVDTTHFVPRDKAPASCLAVGRFVEKKRPDITIRAFATAAEDVPDATLEMIGDGPMLEECKAIAKDTGLSDRIVFHGVRSHDFVRERMARCALFLQHSVTASDGDTEGLPMSIQEAMSSGMVTVSTRHAGIPVAVTEGETGYLCDEGDEAEYTRLIARLLHANAETRAMAGQARADAEARFDRATLLTKVEETINRLV